MLVDLTGPPKDAISRSKTLMLFWMLVDAANTPKDVDGRSKTLMLFWMLVDATGILEDVVNRMILQEHDVFESKSDNKVEDLRLHNP